MAVCDLIAKFILDTLEASGGSAELQRGSIAAQFHCVPSQINYVIATRFSPERGYLVESRRGGGGYIRISRIRTGAPRQLILQTISSVESELSLRTAAAFLSHAVEAGALSPAAAGLILAGISDAALRPVPQSNRGEVRASVFKYMLLQTISD